MMLSGEEGLKCEVCVDWITLKYIAEFKYLGCVLNESSTDEGLCLRKVASDRRVACAIGSLFNARGLLLECARVLRESLLMTGFMYDRDNNMEGEGKV